jgi:hypothetical protein
MLSFLRIRIPRFEPDREVNKWFPIKLTLRQSNGFCGGGEDKSLDSQQWPELDPDCFLVENT